jgi:hypothetical protein
MLMALFRAIAATPVTHGRSHTPDASEPGDNADFAEYAGEATGGDLSALPRTEPLGESTAAEAAATASWGGPVPGDPESLLMVIRDLYVTEPPPPPSAEPSRPTTAAPDFLDASAADDAGALAASRAAVAALASKVDSAQSARRSELGEYMSALVVGAGLASRGMHEGAACGACGQCRCARRTSRMRRALGWWSCRRTGACSWSASSGSAGPSTPPCKAGSGLGASRVSRLAGAGPPTRASGPRRAPCGPPRAADLPINQLAAEHSDPKVEEGLVRIRQLDELLSDKLIAALISHRETFPEQWAEQERKRLQHHSKLVEEALK